MLSLTSKAGQAPAVPGCQRSERTPPSGDGEGIRFPVRIEVGGPGTALRTGGWLAAGNRLR